LYSIIMPSVVMLNVGVPMKLTVELDFLHDGRVVPLAEDDDGQSGVHVAFQFRNFFRKVFLGTNDNLFFFVNCKWAK